MTASLFLVAVGYPNFDRTVSESVALQEYDPPPEVPRELVTAEAVRVWGTRKGGDNREQYEALARNDVLLFYHDGAYIAGGRVGLKFSTPWISRTFWGYAPAELLYTVEDYVEMDCPAEEVHAALGDTIGCPPEGLRQVPQAVAERLAEEYGSLYGFVESLAGDW